MTSGNPPPVEIVLLLVCAASLIAAVAMGFAWQPLVLAWIVGVAALLLQQRRFRRDR